jgi:hypothetical protein
MRWDPSDQIQKLFEPSLLVPSKVSNRDKIIRTTNHGTDRDDDNINKRIDNFSSARISHGQRAILG